jgi:hypothetical protein
MVTNYKPFEKWKYEEVWETFGVCKIPNVNGMQAWLTAQETITPDEFILIEKLRERLAEEHEAWQEDELKFLFISRIINLIDYWHLPEYKTFTQRMFDTMVPNIHNEPVRMRGRVEFFVAKGIQTPRTPLFFLHEYKPQTGLSADPHGQLLAAMVAAQHLNNDGTPLYGCFIIGKDWKFVLMDGKEYSVSRSYDATISTEIIQIIHILRFAKRTIHNRLGISF